MSNKLNLYSKTKQIVTNSKYPENNIIKNTFNTYNNYNNYPNISSDLNKNKYFFENKSNLQINNENIMNINKSIKEGKEKIENILSPIRPSIHKEEIDHQEYQINNKVNQLYKIKTMYNMNCLQINNEFLKIKNKKNKLMLVYNSLFNFRQKLLNKEKELKSKESKINIKENEIKLKESIIKNKFNSFNNYINYETENLMNKFKNLKYFHQQKEDELFIREEKIKEYEMIVKNIIEMKENKNKEKIKECETLRQNIEKKLENEKESQIIKDIEIIEKEKENIEKEKALIEYEKEQIHKEKIQNIKFKKNNNKRAKKLKKIEKIINKSLPNLNDKFPDLDKNINDSFNIPIKEEKNNNSFFGDFYYNKVSNYQNKNYKKKNILTPIGLNYKSARNEASNPFNIKNKNSVNNKDNSSFYDSIYKNNFSSIKLNDESTSQNYKINNSYVHDNIYLLKNKPSSTSKKTNHIIPIPSSISSYRSKDIKKIDNKKLNSSLNRTINYNDNNINKFNLNLTNESLILAKEDEDNKSKYLEMKSDFNETYSEINSKIFETEKALQKIQNQEKKIKIIKDKLDKKDKNSS